jgi:hypothetical protein
MNYRRQKCTYFFKNERPCFLSQRSNLKWSYKTEFQYSWAVYALPGLRVPVLNVEILDSWQFEVQV